MSKFSKASVGGLAAVGAVAVVGAIAYGVPAIAGAASSSPSPAPNSSAGTPDFSRHMTAEAQLSGATASRVKAAVLAKVPGATIERMSAEDSAESSGAAYEAHATKSDGTQVEVLLDKNFKVISTRTGFGGFGGFGGRHGGAESELSGTTASKVKAAVLAKVPGATIERMSAEDSAEGSGAAYEAHATKSDGTQVEVLLDKNFKVLSTRTAPAGFGRFGGPPAGVPGSGGTPSSDGSDGSGSSGGPADYSTVNA